MNVYANFKNYITSKRIITSELDRNLIQKQEVPLDMSQTELKFFLMNYLFFKYDKYQIPVGILHNHPAIGD